MDWVKFFQELFAGAAAIPAALIKSTVDLGSWIKKEIKKIEEEAKAKAKEKKAEQDAKIALEEQIKRENLRHMEALREQRKLRRAPIITKWRDRRRRRAAAAAALAAFVTMNPARAENDSSPVPKPPAKEATSPQVNADPTSPNAAPDSGDSKGAEASRAEQPSAAFGVGIELNKQRPRKGRTIEGDYSVELTPPPAQKGDSQSTPNLSGDATEKQKTKFTYNGETNPTLTDRLSAAIALNELGIKQVGIIPEANPSGEGKYAILAKETPRQAATTPINPTKPSIWQRVKARLLGNNV